MSSITLQDMIRSAAQNVTFLETTLPHNAYHSIREDELLCDERMDDFVLPAPMPLPAAVNHDTRLLAFESREATPLCLKAPTAVCRKRSREETEAVSDNEYHDASPKVPRKNEEWLSWINWDHFAQ